MIIRMDRPNYLQIFGIILVLTLQTTSALKCKFPGAPAHSQVTFTDETLDNGTVAVYTCERGFELLGPARRVCDNGGWVPEGVPFCVLNVAAGKAPMQISTDGIGIPQKAIDGSTSAFFSADTCSITKPERVPWWYVNLLEPYMVQLVRLDFGKSCCGNGKAATIVVRVGNNRPDLGTNPICNRFTGFLEEGQPLFLPCNPPMPGAFVSVHLENSVPSPLSICEAFVYTDQALPIERCPVFRDQPPGASASYNGKCYVFYNRQPLTLRNAVEFCRARGGTLINESNPALQGFISWELWRRHRSDTNSQYWMGAIRDTTNRQWKWLNGDDISVSFWNLPGGDEDCARYDGTKGWLWSDTNCNIQLNYICQHQPKACGRPEQPPNSTMTALQGFTVGSTVDYTCDDGHLLVGPGQRTCLETGFYDEFPPVCKYIECGLPASIPHGFYDLVNGSVGYLSSVIYKCNDGYEMAGRAMLTCDIDERWNGPPPRCEPIQCEQLPETYRGGKIFTPNGTYFNAKAELICPRGFQTEGPRFIACTSTGQWSEPFLGCKEDVLVLPSTPIPVTQYTRPRSPILSSTLPTSRRPISSSPSHPPATPTRQLSTTTTTTTRQHHHQQQPSSTIISTAAPSPFAPTITVHGNKGVTNKDEVGVPDTVPRKTAQPTLITPPPKVVSLRPTQFETTTKNIQNVIQSAHPQDNEIAGSVNIRQDQSPNVNVPFSVENEPAHKEGGNTRLNLGAIIALGAFGGFVFLAAIITTIVILVRRNRTTQHYRHRASPDCNTVASFDSSSSESRNGLNRYYRQAWQDLHESTSKQHNGLRRKETMDQPNLSRSRDDRGRDLDRSRENVTRSRDYSREGLGLRDGSEMMVSDVCVKGEKKRHHHHHHKNNHRNSDFRDSNLGNARRHY